MFTFVPISTSDSSAQDLGETIKQFIQDNKLNQAQQESLYKILGVHANMHLLEDSKTRNDLAGAVVTQSRQSDYQPSKTEAKMIELYKNSDLWQTCDTYFANGISAAKSKMAQFDFIGEVYTGLKEVFTPKPATIVVSAPNNDDDNPVDPAPAQSSTSKKSPLASPRAFKQRKFEEMLTDQNTQNAQVPDSDQTLRTESGRAKTPVTKLCDSIRNCKDPSELALAMKTLQSGESTDMPTQVRRKREAVLEKPSQLAMEVSDTVRYVNTFIPQPERPAALAMIREQLEHRIQNRTPSPTPASSPSPGASSSSSTSTSPRGRDPKEGSPLSSAAPSPESSPETPRRK